MTTTTTYKVEPFIDAEKAATDTMIQETGGMVTADEFNRQSGLVYFYGVQAARAERQLSTFKLQLELAEADAASEIRALAAATGEKTTEASIKADVRKNKKVTALDVALIKAQEVLTVCKTVSEAMRHKKDMLIMRGNQTRDEIKARITVESELSATPSGLRERESEVRDRLAKMNT